MYKTIKHETYNTPVVVHTEFNTFVEAYNMLTDDMQYAPLCDVIEFLPYQYSILEKLCPQYI